MHIRGRVTENMITIEMVHCWILEHFPTSSYEQMNTEPSSTPLKTRRALFMSLSRARRAKRYMPTHERVIVDCWSANSGDAAPHYPDVDCFQGWIHVWPWRIFVDYLKYVRVDAMFGGFGMLGHRRFHALVFIRLQSCFILCVCLSKHHPDIPNPRKLVPVYSDSKSPNRKMYESLVIFFNSDLLQLGFNRIPLFPDIESWGIWRAVTSAL